MVDHFRTKFCKSSRKGFFKKADFGRKSSTTCNFRPRYLRNNIQIAETHDQLASLRNVDFPFLQRAQCTHCKRCISYSNSVCRSVRLLHASIVSKRRHVARCSLHRWMAKCVQFCRNQKIFPRDDPFPLKFWLKVTYPLLKAASFDTFCLVAPQP